MAIDRIKVKKEADKLLTAGKVERAIDEFQKLVDDNPKDYNTLNQIGDLCVQIGRVKEGVEIHKRLGGAYERDGFHARAAAIFQKVVRNAPEDIDAAQRLADLYRQMNKTSDAVKVHLQVAEHFQKKGLIKRALEEFNKVVDLDPKNLKMKVKLADLYNKEGMKDRAAGIYLEVAESLAMEQMHGEANQILERAKAMISTPQVYLTQSRLGVIQGDYTTAAQHLREGLTNNPRNTELLEALAEIELRSGHPDRALEALAEVAQLPEKSLPLCEKALRNLVNGDRAEEGLRLFAPIARELARRGSGDVIGRSLRNALQGNIGIEGWVLLAEIAHQSGNRADQVQALQSAYGMAYQNNDQALISHLAGQLQGMGVVPGAAAPAPATFAPIGLPAGFEARSPQEITRHGGETEVDPVKRLRIEQFSREAEAMLRGGSPERAIETYKKALELDPADLTIIEAIVAVHRTTGRLTQVQMQYVQSAQALVQLDRKREAAHLLDLAEQLFPGSTRIHRRAMGLPEPGVLPPPASRAAIGLPAPAPIPTPSAPTQPIAPPPADDLDMLIGLDLPGFEVPPQRPAPPRAAQPIALGDGLEEALPLLPDLDALPPDPFAPPALPPAPVPPSQEHAALEPSDLSWMDTTLTDFAPEIAASTSAPTAPLPPMPTRQLGQEVIDALSALPDLPEVEATRPVTVPAPEPAPIAPTVPEPVAEDIESLLGDIDFQLDYGSPEEAKIEIEAALQQFPGHPDLQSRLSRAEAALQKLGHVPKASALDESDFANSFFDLTDVLGTALMDSGEGEEMHDATHVVEKIQSVDELFSAFREGVEKQVKGDDYDTHYNLGIAYKEMMLIDPAIEEFKIAMGDPERTLECCSMLSICEQARGDLPAAVEWLRQGILAPGFPPEDSIGLRYDLAEIYLQQGHTSMAAEEFKAVYEMDPDYRDVAARLA
ncbi:MAG: tetratricopeptide repeat protein [Geothrix sp.]|uniref:tetratricopeptide repeat protein n=1 Tax=Geothrix sp. TaxID=1962974 RepID=UPI00182DDB63|nr:tetratricopeptide repeat protein [Geothrix sp.]NWJ40938.1 tetratricopeptide repeat protein [Geothrix sp.]WIL21062.1 MAG: tetratricopeptide repeat protein [Geothrix sp.]